MDTPFLNYPSSDEDPSCALFELCFDQNQCWDADSSKSHTAECFQLALAMISIGLVLISLAELVGRRTERASGEKKTNNKMKFGRIHSGSEVIGSDIDDAVFQLDAAFVTTRRTVSNFIRNNSDPDLQIPNAYAAEYMPKFVGRGVYPVSGFLPECGRWTMVGSSVFRASWIGSLGWAMVCSGISTLLWNLVHYEQTCHPETTFIRDWIDSIGGAFDILRGDYDYYPIFLIVGYLAFVVSRWREFMVNCHTIQAKLHDTALLCGGSVLPTPSAQMRRKLYRIYRYLNLIHVLCYKSVSPSVGHLAIETDFVHLLGLLEVHEVDELLPMDNKLRDTVIGWLATEVASFLLMDGVNAQFAAQQLADAVTGIRAATARHHDLFVRDNPNLYLNLMLMIVNFIVFLVIVGYPFSLVVYTPSFFPIVPCFQPVCLIGVFVLVSSFRTAYSLLVRLRNPFSWTNDRIKVDNLLASTDRAIFALLRSNFKKDYQGMTEVEIRQVRSPTRPRLSPHQMGRHPQNRSQGMFFDIAHSTSTGRELLVTLEEARDV